MSTTGNTKSSTDLIRVGHLWDDLSDFIIRPERSEYNVTDLGPPIFRISDYDGAEFKRTDLELENMRGLKLTCSWYRPAVAASSASSAKVVDCAQREKVPDGGSGSASSSTTDASPSRSIEKTPCIVYLHGNQGSRWDGLELLPLLRYGFTLFTYDASGSGHSEGEYVTLGFYERQDLAAVIEYLESTQEVSTIGLWGRSMGAVTSIMYASKDKSIQCLVCDSPFASLRRLVGDLVTNHAPWLPNFATETAVAKIRKRIAKKAHFDIDDLDAMKYARESSAPAFIFHGKDDDFVSPAHSEAVAECYGGSCMHHLVRGGHNSSRRNDVFRVALPFFQLYLIEKPAAALAAAKQKELDEPQQKQRTQKRKISGTTISITPSAATSSSSVGGRKLSEDPPLATTATKHFDPTTTVTSDDILMTAIEGDNGRQNGPQSSKKGVERGSSGDSSPSRIDTKDEDDDDDDTILVHPSCSSSFTNNSSQPSTTNSSLTGGMSPSAAAHTPGALPPLGKSTSLGDTKVYSGEHFNQKKEGPPKRAYEAEVEEKKDTGRREDKEQSLENSTEQQQEEDDVEEEEAEVKEDEDAAMVEEAQRILARDIVEGWNMNLNPGGTAASKNIARDEVTHQGGSEHQDDDRNQQSSSHHKRAQTYATSCLDYYSGGPAAAAGLSPSDQYLRRQRQRQQSYQSGGGHDPFGPMGRSHTATDTQQQQLHRRTQSSQQSATSSVSISPVSGGGRSPVPLPSMASSVFPNNQHQRVMSGPPLTQIPTPPGSRGHSRSASGAGSKQGLPDCRLAAAPPTAKSIADSEFEAIFGPPQVEKEEAERQGTKALGEKGFTAAVGKDGEKTSRTHNARVTTSSSEEGGGKEDHHCGSDVMMMMTKESSSSMMSSSTSLKSMDLGGDDDGEDS